MGHEGFFGNRGGIVMMGGLCVCMDQNERVGVCSYDRIRIEFLILYLAGCFVMGG